MLIPGVELIMFLRFTPCHGFSQDSESLEEDPCVDADGQQPRLSRFQGSSLEELDAKDEAKGDRLYPLRGGMYNCYWVGGHRY